MTDTRLQWSPHEGEGVQARTGGCPEQKPTVTNLSDVIVSRAMAYGEHCFLRHARSTRKTSFAALSRAVMQWKHWLNNLGIAEDQRVAIAIADPLEFAAVFLAIMANGRWVAPLDPSAPPRSTLAAIDRLRPALVISDRAAPAATSARWVELAAVGVRPGHPGRVAADAGRPGIGSRGGAVLLSSGSTGQPKIIFLHQRQLLHTARAVAEHHRLTTADVGFNPLPLFHVNAEVVGLLASLWAGAQLVLDERFHRTDFWRLMEDLGVTWINAVPAVISRLAPPSPSEPIPRTLRFVRSASAPLSVAVLKRFEESTGVAILETYGMTEAASQITANPLEGPRKPGSVGLPVGIELRVVTDVGCATGSPPGSRTPGSGKPLGPAEAAVGETGYVEIRGPSVDVQAETPAVEGSDASTRRAGGWLRTGDIGCLDVDGYLYLQGREDDVINRGGEKVYPREIEDALLEDPRVIDALVIGVDDESLGQVPAAYVTMAGVVDSNDAWRALSIVIDARERLVKTLPMGKRPVSMNVLPRLPTTTTGKLLRPRLGPVGDQAILTVDIR